MITLLYASAESLLCASLLRKNFFFVCDCENFALFLLSLALFHAEFSMKHAASNDNKVKYLFAVECYRKL